MAHIIKKLLHRRLLWRSTRSSGSPTRTPWTSTARTASAPGRPTTRREKGVRWRSRMTMKRAQSRRKVIAKTVNARDGDELINNETDWGNPVWKFDTVPIGCCAIGGRRTSIHVDWLLHQPMHIRLLSFWTKEVLGHYFWDHYIRITLYFCISFEYIKIRRVNESIQWYSPEFSESWARHLLKRRAWYKMCAI